MLEIVKWPAKVLSTRAQEVTNFDDSLRVLEEDMYKAMSEANGIGLAANQVGGLRRILVTQINGARLTLVNPVIVERIEEITWREGCLSFPGIYEYISGRAKTIKVEAFDTHGNLITVDATDLLAVCIQHEIDHLDGKVFLDRMSRLKKQIAIKKLNK